MSVHASQLTVEQAHKEFNSLVDKIVGKYEQLDSGEFGAVGTFTSMPSLLNWHVILLATILQVMRSTFQI